MQPSWHELRRWVPTSDVSSQLWSGFLKERTRTATSHTRQIFKVQCGECKLERLVFLAVAVRGGRGARDPFSEKTSCAWLHGSTEDPHGGHPGARSPDALNSEASNLSLQNVVLDFMPAFSGKPFATCWGDSRCWLSCKSRFPSTGIYRARAYFQR